MNVLLHGPSDEVFKKWLNSMMKVVEYPLQKDGDDVKVDGEDKEKTVGNQKLKEEAELNSKEDVEFPVQQDSDDGNGGLNDKESSVYKKLKQKVNLHSKEDDNERSIAKTDGNASKKAQTKWPVKRIRIRESN
uniref:PH domain-containing protein n=1 Tax=Cannabis sativa TaxID=3483 RepID=A0A803QRR6_CANSA